MKECIESLEVEFKELQCRFRKMGLGVAKRPIKIEETISRLFKALLFNRADEASNNPELVPFKSHSQSVEK